MFDDDLEWPEEEQYFIPDNSIDSFGNVEQIDDWLSKPEPHFRVKLKNPPNQQNEPDTDSNVDFQMPLNLKAHDFESLQEMIDKAKEIAREEAIKRRRNRVPVPMIDRDRQNRNPKQIIVKRPNPKHHKAIHIDNEGEIVTQYGWLKICHQFTDQMDAFVNSIPDEEIKDGLSMDDLRSRFEQKFGVNITNNGMSKFKNFHDYFVGQRLRRNGWRGLFYFKKKK